MSYIAVSLNHFRAIQSWARLHGAQATLDVNNFELEIKARNRFFKLYPQFLDLINGRLGHVPVLGPHCAGFIGWLPYRPISWELSSDKLLFKRFLSNAGMRTPAWWSDAAQSDSDYLLKQSVGSFGYELFGPFRQRSNTPNTSLMNTKQTPLKGVTYAERFVVGRNIKVWAWGQDPFFAHVHDYPFIEGDGKQTVLELVEARLRAAGITDNPATATSNDMAVLHRSLEFQGIEMQTMPASGARFWLDYRYGRRYTNERARTQTDNRLASLSEPTLGQVAQVTHALGQAMARHFSAPVLYSVDGVIDQSNNIWWLETNSNPILPPDGYANILTTLFGPSSVENVQ